MQQATIRNSTFGLVMISMFILMVSTSVCLAQKTYSIAGINSQVSLSSSTCYVSIVETYTYDFTGSYSTVARAVPYSIASSVDLSSLRIDVLTGGYSLSSKTVSAQQDSNFIVANIYPSTPVGLTTRIIIRYTYSVMGPIRVNSNKQNVVSYYYKESAPIGSLTSSFVFSPDVILADNVTTSGGSASVYGNTVTFTSASIISNIVYQPSVTFSTVGDQFSKCTGGLSISIIIVIVVLVVICICYSIICGIITAFRNCVMELLGFRRPAFGYAGETTRFVGDSTSGGRGSFTGTSGFAN